MRQTRDEIDQADTRDDLLRYYDRTGIDADQFTFRRPPSLAETDEKLARLLAKCERMRDD